MSESRPDIAALRAELEADGRVRIDRVRREARARIDAMRSEAERAEDLRRAAALRGPEKTARVEAARHLSEVRAEARRRVLEARDALLERIFARARELVDEAILEPGPRTRLVERAREALDSVPEGERLITCSPALVEPLEAAIGDRAGVRITARPDDPAGFRLHAAGGALEVDGTLAGLLESARPELAIEILRRLDETPP